MKDIETSSSSASIRCEKTSSILKYVIDENKDKSVHLGFLIEQFKDRSFGGLLLILSILAILPIVSFLAGLIILIVGIQMLLGLSIPMLPKFIYDQKVEKTSFESFVNKAVPWLEKVQVYIKPRWFFLSSLVVQRLLGLVIILLALVSLMPLPFSNLPPSIALFVIALGVLEKDGVVITIGLLISSLAVMLGYFILLVLINSISLLT